MKSKGGYRAGSGRPYGTGKYKEKTHPVRIPESLLPTVRGILDRYIMDGKMSNDFIWSILGTVQ